MKNFSFKVLLLVTFSVSLLTSCEKETETKKVVNVTIAKNETYSASLSSLFQTPDALIDKQARHASSSMITDKATYNYTPATDYVGTDEVRLEQGDNEDHHDEQHDGACKKGKHHEHDDDDETTTIIKITVVDQIN